MLSRTQLEIRVTYSAPAFHCRRALRVLPLHRAGQIVRHEAWKFAPTGGDVLEKHDELRNRRLLFQHPRIDREWLFQMECEVETDGAPLLDLSPELGIWKMTSRAVLLSPELQQKGRDAKNLPAIERATHFAEMCCQHLQYEAKTNDHPRDAGQIWTLGHGNCADFTHVFLSLCRASGLGARYVAGFNATQGQMHAWAEVWADHHWHAFDPTLGRRISRGSVAVAIGRDFYDCLPHEGTFRGPASAHLELICRTTTQSEN